MTEKLTVMTEYLGEEIAPRIYSGASALLSYASSYIWTPVFDPAKAKELLQKSQIRVRNKMINLKSALEQKIQHVGTLLQRTPVPIAGYVCCLPCLVVVFR